MILAINTVTIKNEITIILEDNSTRTLSWNQQGNEAELLLPKINELLGLEEKKLHDLKGILVVTGPGPFSAVRVGVTAANALAYALEIPLHVITTFELFEKSAAAEAVLIRSGRPAIFLKLRNELEPRIFGLVEAAEFLKNRQIIACGDLYTEQKQYFLEQDIQILAGDHLFEKLSDMIAISELPRVKIADITYFKDANISPCKNPLSFV